MVKSVIMKQRLSKTIQLLINTILTRLFFLKTRLADLGETYKRSNLARIKLLLGSIFLSGLARNYNGTLNNRISPLYQAILGFTEQNVRSCAEEGRYFEPLLQLLIDFNKFMEAYQAAGGDDKNE